MMGRLNMENDNKKEKKKLTAHKYKLMLKSLAAGKSKGSDLSVKKTEEENISEQNCSNEDETDNPDSSFSRTERVVCPSGNAERSKSSIDAAKTNERMKGVSESSSNLDDMSRLTKNSTHCDNGGKSVTTNFLEYWVPVKLSNVQTEQYCSFLFSNAILLCSHTKLRSSGKLHGILVATRKCCDHPYLVDRSLRTSLIQGIPQPEQLDAEIKLSNKLLLLHKILVEIKKRGLRVLLLYQSFGGSGLISTGDVLDDIIHEKFGDDSFVRIDRVISRSKRRDTLKTFNEKGGKENDQCRQKFKSELREKIASWIKRQCKASVLAGIQTTTSGNPASAEQHSELPPDEPDHPVPEAAGVSPERSVWPSESSQNSRYCQLPEASQGTHSKSLQSACKSLEIELEKLEKQKTECLKQHEEMKLQMKMACEKEIDEIPKKYDTLLQNAELAFAEKKEGFETRCNKISINKSLAEAVMQTDTSIGVTLTEGLCSSVAMQASTVVESNQTSASATGASESHANPCVNILHRMPSLQAVPFQSSVAATTNRSLAIPSIDAPQLLPNLATSFLRNIQENYHFRAPAPHLRNVWRPLAATTPKTSNGQQPLS